MLAEDLHLVALLTVNARDIDHGHIHTDIAYVLRLLAVYQAIAVAIAQVTVQAVGIAYGDGSNHGVMVYRALTAIAYCLSSLHLPHLEDGGLEGADGMENAVVAWVHAIEPDAQATHIHLSLREMLDAGRVVHVAQYLVAEGTLQFTASLVEALELQGREVVEVVAVGPYEM